MEQEKVTLLYNLSVSEIIKLYRKSGIARFDQFLVKAEENMHDKAVKLEDDLDTYISFTQD